MPCLRGDFANFANSAGLDYVCCVSHSRESGVFDDEPAPVGGHSLGAAKKHRAANKKEIAPQTKKSRDGPNCRNSKSQ